MPLSEGKSMQISEQNKNPKKELEEEVGVDWADVRRCDFYALLDTGAEQGHKHSGVGFLGLWGFGGFRVVV